MTQTPSLPTARLANGQFAPGNPGRRAGSRNRASHRVVMAILRDFERNQDELLDRLRMSFPTAYFNTVAHLAPALIDGGGQEAEAGLDLESMNDVDIIELFSRAFRVVSNAKGPRSGLIDLENVLAGGLPASLDGPLSTVDSRY